MGTFFQTLNRNSSNRKPSSVRGTEWSRLLTVLRSGLQAVSPPPGLSSARYRVFLYRQEDLGELSVKTKAMSVDGQEFHKKDLSTLNAALQRSTLIQTKAV